MRTGTIVLRGVVSGVASMATLLTLALPASGQTMSVSPRPAHEAFTTDEPGSLTGADRSIARRIPTRSTCPAVRHHLKQYASRGIRRVMCVTTGPAVKATGVPALCVSDLEEFTRLADCIEEGWHVEIIDDQTGQVLGTNDGTSTFWNNLSYKSRVWTESVQVTITDVTGVGAKTLFTAPFECNDTTPGDCQTTGSGSWRAQTKYIGAGVPYTDTGNLGYGSAATSVTTMSFTLGMNFENPATTNPAPVPIGPTTNIRCDSSDYFTTPNGGCAYPAFTTNILSVSTVDPTVSEAAQFMEDAQNAIPTHAGKLGYKALTRLTDKNQIAGNRRVACKGVTIGAGQSCDEYPFASTYQGAALVPKADYRSQALSAAQNSKVGSILGSFLLKNRIMDSDPFYVSITS